MTESGGKLVSKGEGDDGIELNHEELGIVLRLWETALENYDIEVVSSDEALGFLQEVELKLKA